MDNETFRYLWMDEQIESVFKELDDSYRHGNYIYEVFKDNVGRFWAVNYTVSGDNEQHGIRDNEFDIHEVVAYTETEVVTKYKPKV